jgi:hypothetical protein
MSEKGIKINKYYSKKKKKIWLSRISLTNDHQEELSKCAQLGHRNGHSEGLEGRERNGAVS